MTYAVTLTSKNQITLPARLVKELALQKGDTLLIRKTNETMEMKKAESIIDQLAGSLSLPSHLKGIPLDEQIERAKRQHFEK